MYVPSQNICSEKEKIRQLVAQNGFATVLSFPENEGVFINHLPIIFSSKPGQEEVLIGHMSKRNPQWKHFKENPRSLFIFHGAHAYITPTWYKSGRDVPTWNYAIVHLHGEIELLDSFDEQVETLKQISSYFESSEPSPWEFELPDDLTDESALTSAIISFKFHVKKTEAKFKLSQNRSSEDRRSIIEGLKRRKDEMSHTVSQLMESEVKSE